MVSLSMINSNGPEFAIYCCRDCRRNRINRYQRNAQDQSGVNLNQTDTSREIIKPRRKTQPRDEKNKKKRDDNEEAVGDDAGKSSTKSDNDSKGTKQTNVEAKKNRKRRYVGTPLPNPWTEEKKVKRKNTRSASSASDDTSTILETTKREARKIRRASL